MLAFLSPQVVQSKGTEITHQSKHAHAVVSYQLWCDRDDDDVEDVLGRREEGRDDARTSLNHEVGDGRVESVKQRKQVEDAF